MSRTILAIVFLIATLAVGAFYARPQWNQFSDASRQVSDLLQTTRQYDDLVKNRDSLLSALNAISKDNLDRADQALPLGADASEFLVALEAYTVANGVTLKRVDLVSPSGDERRSLRDQPSSAEAVPPARAGTPPQPKPAAAGGGTEKTDRREISELPFGVEVSGSYEGIKKFLAALERNIRIIDISDISFNAPGKAGEPMSVSIKAKTYYQ